MLILERDQNESEILDIINEITGEQELKITSPKLHLNIM